MKTYQVRFGRTPAAVDRQPTFSMYFALGSKSWALTGCLLCLFAGGGVVSECAAVVFSGPTSPPAPIFAFRSATKALPMSCKSPPPRPAAARAFPRMPVTSSIKFSPDRVKGSNPVLFVFAAAARWGSLTGRAVPDRGELANTSYSNRTPCAWSAERVDRAVHYNIGCPV